MPITEHAQLWSGWASSLKPAWEPILIAMKPLDGSFAENALKHGVAGLNIDGSRIGLSGGSAIPSGMDRYNAKLAQHGYRPGSYEKGVPEVPKPAGRWPSNLILSHSPDCVCLGTTEVMNRSGKASGPTLNAIGDGNIYSPAKGERKEVPFYGGLETVERWACVPDCPVRILDDQSGRTKTKRIEKPSDCGGNTWGGTFQTNRGARGHTDEGGASRFFYCAKASPSERDKGLEEFYWKLDSSSSIGFVRVTRDEWEHLDPKCRAHGNVHPTVKPLDLMRYLARLTKTPTGGVVLDPFMGSGTTGIAALLEGRDFIGIEMAPEYVEIARARIKAATSDEAPLFEEPEPPLFGEGE